MIEHDLWLWERHWVGSTLGIQGPLAGGGAGQGRHHDSPPREGSRVRTAAAVAAPSAALVAYFLWIRRLLTWGASPDEISHTYPTDELIDQRVAEVLRAGANSEPEPEFLLVPDAARLAGLSPKTIYNYLTDGCLTRYGVRGAVLARRVELLELIERRR